MYKKITKRWVVCIGVALFILCFSIGMSSMLIVSAEEPAPEQTQVYDYEQQEETVDYSNLEPKDCFII